MKKKLVLLLVVFAMIFTTAACNKKVKAEDLENKPPEGIESPVVDDQNKDDEELFYVLYLRHKDLPYIFSDTYSITNKDSRIADKSLELFVLEELIKQQKTDDLVNPIPVDTRVLSVNKQGTKVIVDLSKEFQLNMRGSKDDVNIAIAVIVNTLTTLPGNDSVIILVEGTPVTNLRGVDISGEYEFIIDYYADK